MKYFIILFFSVLITAVGFMFLGFYFTVDTTAIGKWLFYICGCIVLIPALFWWIEFFYQLAGDD